MERYRARERERETGCNNHVIIWIDVLFVREKLEKYLSAVDLSSVARSPQIIGGVPPRFNASAGVEFQGSKGGRGADQAGQDAVFLFYTDHGGEKSVQLRLINGWWLEVRNRLIWSMIVGSHGW